MAEAFPLAWPDGWPRAKTRRRASYRVEFSKALTELKRELRLMSTERRVISSNVPLQRTGEPYAAAGGKRYDDPGVAVYFLWRGQPWVVACDQWDLVKDNLRAVGLTLQALRLIARTGASDLMKRAYLGFKALPPVGGTTTPGRDGEPYWWEVLQVDRQADRAAIMAAFREQALKIHPDRGGSSDSMARLNRARDKALESLEIKNTIDVRW